MTELCGVFSIIDGTDCRSDLDTMIRSLANHSENKATIWRNDSIALGQRTLQITPESFLETTPYIQGVDNHFVIIGDIRLDNREELCIKLGLQQHVQNQYGDIPLVLESYKKWGESCPEYFIGDFSFALWDGTKQKLICCTDHFGIRSLFYFFDGKRFIFASTPNPILAIKTIRSSINQNKLATLIFPDVNYLFREESWFENIFPLPAATILSVDKNSLRKRKYWTPEVGKELIFKNEEEYAEAFQDLLFRAVGDRLRSQFPVTALLSGGLDSSAIVSVAARILEKQNRELQVFSAVVPDEADPVLTDERYFINQFRSFPNIKINYITAPERGFFSDLEALQTTIYGPNLISRHYLYTAFVEKAQALGSRVILDGNGGELGATFHGDGGYAELFWQMRWPKLWHEMSARKALVGESIRSNLFSKVFRPLIPGHLINLVRNRNIGLEKTRVHCIQPEFTEQLKARLEPRRKELENIFPRISPSHRHNQLRLLHTRQYKAQGAPDLGQVELRFPLMDKRLLEFCLSLPLDLKIKNGYTRYSVRAGLNKVLPPEIQWRNSKGAFSPDYNRRYKEQLSQAKEFLNTISTNDPVRAIVDIDKLKVWINIPLKDEEYGTFAEKTARDFVPQGIYLIHFLRRFTEFQI